MTTTTKTTVTCPKCLGARYFRTWGHIVGGRCFTCGGSGVIEVKESNYVAAEVTLDAQFAKRCAWIAALPTSYAACKAVLSKVDNSKLDAIFGCCCEIMHTEDHNNVAIEDRNPGVKMCRRVALELMGF